MKRKDWLKNLKVGDKVFVEKLGGSPYLEFTLYTVNNWGQAFPYSTTCAIKTVNEVSEDYVKVDGATYIDGIYKQSDSFILKISKLTPKKRKMVKEISLKSEVFGIIDAFHSQVHKMNLTTEQFTYLQKCFINMPNSKINKEKSDWKLEYEENVK